MKLIKSGQAHSLYSAEVYDPVSGQIVLIRADHRGVSITPSGSFDVVRGGAAAVTIKLAKPAPPVFQLDLFPTDPNSKPPGSASLQYADVEAHLRARISELAP